MRLLLATFAVSAAQDLFLSKETSLGNLDELERSYSLLKDDACSTVLGQLPVLPGKDTDAFLGTYVNATDDSEETRIIDLASTLLSNSKFAAFLSLSDSFSPGGLDASLVQCVVLSESTPKGLAVYAAQGQTQKDVVGRLLADTILMRDMLVAGGAQAGKYAEAMSIYEQLVKASRVLNTTESSGLRDPIAWDDRSQKNILRRVAVGTAVELTVPLKTRYLEEEIYVDPVQRYLHYEQAYLDGELDPFFEALTVFETRLVINGDGRDEDLAWFRRTLENYRPEDIKSDYGWRYTWAVRSDVAYDHLQWIDNYEHSYQLLPATGGICGPRAFFGRIARKSFGLPTWGVAQPGHAALSLWTPKGWTIELGGSNWKESHYHWNGTDRNGEDWFLETQCREYRMDFQKVLRMQWVASALGEAPVPANQQFGHRKGAGLWSTLSLYLKKITIQQKGPAAGREIGASLVATKVESYLNASTPAPAAITTRTDGTIAIPAAACSFKNSSISIIKSFEHGLQLTHLGGKDVWNPNATNFEYEITVDADSSYFLTANFSTWHFNQTLLVSTNASVQQLVPIYYNKGEWNETQPVEVKLMQGKNVIRFDRATTRPVTFKEFFLYKTKPVVPAPEPRSVPVPAPPSPPADDYIVLGKELTCVSQGIVVLDERECEIACNIFGYKYTGSRSRDWPSEGCFSVAEGPYAGNCNYNSNHSSDPEPTIRALCSRT